MMIRKHNDSGPRDRQASYCRYSILAIVVLAVHCFPEDASAAPGFDGRAQQWCTRSAVEVVRDAEIYSDFGRDVRIKNPALYQDARENWTGNAYRSKAMSGVFFVCVQSRSSGYRYAAQCSWHRNFPWEQWSLKIQRPLGFTPESMARSVERHNVTIAPFEACG